MFIKILQLSMAMLLIVQFSAPGSQPSAADLTSGQILITFEDTDPDSLGWSPWGHMANNSWMFPVKEDIKNVPENLETIHTFHLPMQPGQCALNGALKDEEIHKLIFEDDTEYYNTGMTYSQYLQSRYTAEPVDGIVSVCVVRKDESEFVIVDVNNDEDLTNDPVLPYSVAPASAAPEGTAVQKHEYVDVNATVEYCDSSKKTISRKVPLRFSKRSIGDWQTYAYSIRQVKSGRLSLDGKEYRVVLTDSGLDFDAGSELVIDADGNSRLDGGDFSARLYQPFSFEGASYEAAKIDPEGGYLILEKVDIPVVQMGFPAPDFETTTLDSKRFKLSECRGRFVLIDFWATWCGPCVGETPFLKEAYEQYRKKGLDMVAIAIQDDPKKVEAYARENKLDWTQICHKSDEIMKLYQVSAIPAAFLINPEGVLVSQGAQLSGENLKSTLAKHLKNE